MPRSSSLTRELNSLPISGGVSGRKCRKEESQGKFNVDLCTSSVIPSENVRSSPLSDVEDEITDSDSKSSSEYSDVNSEVYNSDTECKEHTVNGNHLIKLPSLVYSIQDSTVCRCCANESTNAMFESFITFCEAEMNRIKHKVEGKPIKYQLTRFWDMLSIRNCHQKWRSTEQVMQRSILQVREHTY